LDSYKSTCINCKIKATKKINRDKLSDLDKAKIKEIEALLGKSIVGSVAFKTLN
jgi:hypothetical protein